MVCADDGGCFEALGWSSGGRGGGDGWIMIFIITFVGIMIDEKIFFCDECVCVCVW